MTCASSSSVAQAAFAQLRFTLYGLEASTTNCQAPTMHTWHDVILGVVVGGRKFGRRQDSWQDAFWARERGRAVFPGLIDIDMQMAHTSQNMAAAPSPTPTPPHPARHSDTCEGGRLATQLCPHDQVVLHRYRFLLLPLLPLLRRSAELAAGVPKAPGMVPNGPGVVVPAHTAQKGRPGDVQRQALQRQLPAHTCLLGKDAPAVQRGRVVDPNLPSAAPEHTACAPLSAVFL